MKYTASIVASTALWFIFPLMLELTSGTKTEYGWFRFWSGFPKFTLYWYAMFIPVAIVMHLLFARITIKLKGWKFWAFPIVSLSVAGFLVWVMLSFATGIEKGKLLDWSPDWIYGVLYVYAVVFVRTRIGHPKFITPNEVNSPSDSPFSRSISSLLALFLRDVRRI